MGKPDSKTFVHQLYQAMIKLGTQRYDDRHLSRSAIVFSPHQDDETLGCGGTIIHKKTVGADLRVVYMTDGSRSHSHLIPETELKEIRAREAIAATQTLGIETENVLFFDFQDGELNQNQEPATQKVISILQQFQPEEVFIPFHHDRQVDHDATNQIVLTALKQCSFNVTVYEYPIWFWRHFPITGLTGGYREKLSILKNSLLSGFGLQILKDFHTSIYVGDVLEQKRTALNCHRSQMSQLLPDRGWLTLNDIAKGEFVECFFQNYEIFRQYTNFGSHECNNNF